MDDALLFDWLRHYGRLILLFFALGAGASAVLYRAYPPDYTAGTIIASTGTAIPPRSFGAVAIAVSRSSEVYESAGAALGVDEPLRDFFQDHSDVVSIPGSNVLVVVGKAQDGREARRISREIGDAVAKVLQRRTDSQIQVFPRPEQTDALDGFSFQVALSLGGAAGLLAGIASSVALYRQRRPVLSALRAASLVGASEITIYDVKVEGQVSWLRSKRLLERVVRTLRVSSGNPEASSPGPRHASENGRRVVGHAGTAERELILQASLAKKNWEQPQLLWVR